MKPLNFFTSACRYCRFYQPEGRRGGVCLSLEVPVQGSWKACALAKPPFASNWEGLGGMIKWSGRGQGDKVMGGQGEKDLLYRRLHDSGENLEKISSTSGEACTRESIPSSPLVLPVKGLT